MDARFFSTVAQSEGSDATRLGTSQRGLPRSPQAPQMPRKHEPTREQSNGGTNRVANAFLKQTRGEQAEDS